MSSSTRCESAASKSSASTDPIYLSDGVASSSRNHDARREPATYPSSVQSSVLSSSSKDAFKDIQKLLDLLHEYKVPGPRLLRLKKEFRDPVGSGTQGQVRAASRTFTQSLALAARSKDKRLAASAEYWPRCVIKRLRISDKARQNKSQEENLKLVADSALSEVQSLCRAKRLQSEIHHIHGHRQLNVVALAGWGLCLDAMESGSMAENRLPFLILERAHCDLERFMTDKQLYSTLSYLDKCSIAYEIGSGLEAIHTDGLCHGDLKPANVLIFDGGLSRMTPGRPHWYAKICDFGSARPAANTSVHGDYLGTPGWLPPEKHYGSNVRDVSYQLCDIFAYGLVTWSLFLGDPTSPINDFQPNEMIEKMGKQEFYNRARRTVRLKYQPAATRIAQDKEHAEELHRRSRLADLRRQSQSRWAQRGFMSVILRFLERWSTHWELSTLARSGRSTEPDFGSDTNRILAALAVALDEQPRRRNVVKPHIFFEDSVEQVFAVQKPATFHKSVEHSAPDTGRTVEPSLMTRARRTFSTTQEHLRNTANTSANKLLLLLKQIFPALVAGGLRQRIFEDFHVVFVDVLGFNSDTDEILQHRTDEACASLHSSQLRKLKRLLRKYFRAEQRTEMKHAEYALARIRSRFRLCCWEHLFSRQHELYEEIFDRLEKVELKDCSSSAAWALRHKSASDFASTQVKSYDVAMFFDFLHLADSDEQRTFRMLLLLEKHFYLGQTVDGPLLRTSFFYQYLLSLSDPQSALMLCRHFRRVAALDWTTKENKQFYTGSLDSFHADRTACSDTNPIEVYQNTCLHDAVRAGNYAVVEYLVRAGFVVTARNGNHQTAYDLAILMVQMRNTRSDDEIVDLLSQHSSNVTFRSKLPLGWEEIPVSNSTAAYIETSIEDDVYPITFQTPLQGFFQNRNIALAQRQVHGEDDLTFILNPLRFLRAPKDLAESQKPAETPYFDDLWYREDIKKTRQPNARAIDDERAWYRGLAKFAVYAQTVSSNISLIRGDVVLAFVPLCIIARILNWSAPLQLAFSVSATAPLVGHILHHAQNCVQTENGLLVALVACVPEAVVAAFCLYHGDKTLCLDIVLGSVICNNLLVLGGAFFVQGIRHKEQYYNEAISSTLTWLSTFGPFCSVILYVFYATRGQAFPSHTTNGVLLLSRTMAIVCLITDLLHFIFRFQTHTFFFEEDEDIDQYPSVPDSLATALYQASPPVPRKTSNAFPHRAQPANGGILPVIPEDTENEYEEGWGTGILPGIVGNADRDAALSFLVGPRQYYALRLATIIATAILTAFTTYNVSSNLVLLPHQPGRLLALLVIPATLTIWTNIQSLQLSYHGQASMVIDRVVGASLQMTLLVAPCLVLMGWALGEPLTLRFDLFETVTYCLSLWVVAVLLQDGKANWIKGLMLVGVYGIFAWAARFYV